MNRKGGFTLGSALLLILFILVISAFALIEVFKESLDGARGSAHLNCPGVPDFNQTDYDLQDSRERLTKRPSCFVTGISMLWFISTFVIAAIVWTVNNWRRK